MDPALHVLGPSRRGNTLMLVLGIALLLGIQIYIVHTFAMGSFRHLEKVNAHIRAIYVGESAFARILARIKADRWENRWFKGTTVRDADQPLAGGSYSSVVADVASPSEKLVDVWIESRFDQSLSLMYYRVVYADDTLDFVAQVYPRFFSFLEPSTFDPFNNLPAAAAAIQSQIQQQEANQAAAIAELEKIKGTCSLAQVGASLGNGFATGPGLDVMTVPGGGPPVDLCSYFGASTGALSGIAGLPPPGPLPPPPSPPVGDDVIAVIRGQLPGLPATPAETLAGKGLGNLFDDVTEANAAWTRAYYDHPTPPRPLGHNLQDHVRTFLQNMVARRDAVILTDPGTAARIKEVADAVIAFLQAKAVPFGAAVQSVGLGDEAGYMTAYDYYYKYLYASSGGVWRH